MGKQNQKRKIDLKKGGDQKGPKEKKKEKSEEKIDNI